MSSQTTKNAPRLGVVARLAAAEAVGTALLVLAGLSLVIFNFGTGSPLARVIPSPGARRLITGFLFGAVGATIAISPLGKSSGAHINPVVTIAFWLRGKMHRRQAIAYLLSQCVGAVVGVLPLLAWGAMGRSVEFGATVPGADGTWVAVAGEVTTTFLMITLLLFFLREKRLRDYTPLLFPVLYMLLVWIEAPLSGTSTNPARSLGPAVIAHDWRGFWIYVVGPLAGMALALGVHASARLSHLEREVAKLYHFDHDPHGVLNR